jgi:hypothetical protein
LTATDTVIGTCAYMAHEQVRGQEIDHRVDVWALGVMLYEMLTGFLPFRGNNQGQIWTAICTHDPEPMQNIAPGAAVPEAAEAIVRRALARERDDRFPTVEALACAIADVTTSRSVTAPGKRTGRAPPPLPKTSPTFVCGPTAAQERPAWSTWTALEAEVLGGTEETPQPGSGTVTGGGRHTELAPVGESMDTAAVGQAIYTVMAFAPVSSRGPKRAVGPPAALGLTGVALAVWLSQGTADSAMQTTMIDEVTNPVVEVPHEPPPAPTFEPDTIMIPDDVPAPAVPAAAPESAPPTATKRPAPPTAQKPRTYKENVLWWLKSVSNSKAMKACFSASKDPLQVDITVSPKSGTVEAAVDLNNTGSKRYTCMMNALQAAIPPRGAPGDAPVVVRYSLSKAGGKRFRKLVSSSP